MKDGIDIVKLLEEGKTIQIKPQGYSMYPMLLPGRGFGCSCKSGSGPIEAGGCGFIQKRSRYPCTA